MRAPASGSGRHGKRGVQPGRPASSPLPSRPDRRRARSPYSSARRPRRAPPARIVGRAGSSLHGALLRRTPPVRDGAPGAASGPDGVRAGSGSRPERARSCRSRPEERGADPRPDEGAYAIAAGMLNTTSVPNPGLLHTSRLPPIFSARSRIPLKPKWPAGGSRRTACSSNPLPSSRTRTRNRRSS